MLDALEDNDTIRRDEAARFVLLNAGRQRGTASQINTIAHGEAAVEIAGIR